MAKKKGERGTDYYAPSGSRYWQYAGRLERDVPKRVPTGSGESRPVRIPGRDGGNNPYASKQTPPTYNRESAAKNSKSITQSGYNYDKKSRVTKANNAAATKNSQSIAKAGTVYRPSGSNSKGDEGKRILDNAFGEKTTVKGLDGKTFEAESRPVHVPGRDYDNPYTKVSKITPGKQTQDKGIVTTAPKSSPKANTAAATKNAQSISQSGYNYDRNKQTGRKQIEEAFKPNTSGKPTGKIVKHEEPKYNPAKINAEAKARSEAQSKAAAAQAAAKANAKGGMSEEAKKKAAAAAARRGR